MESKGKIAYSAPSMYSIANKMNIEPNFGCRT